MTHKEETVTGIHIMCLENTGLCLNFNNFVIRYCKFISLVCFNRSSRSLTISYLKIKAKLGYMTVNIQVSQLWPRRSRSHWLNLIFHSSGTILRCNYLARWRISSRIKPQLPILFAHRAQELTTELACPPPSWLFPVPIACFLRSLPPINYL